MLYRTNLDKCNSIKHGKKYVTLYHYSTTYVYAVAILLLV